MTDKIVETDPVPDDDVPMDAVPPEEVPASGAEEEEE